MPFKDSFLFLLWTMRQLNEIRKKKNPSEEKTTILIYRRSNHSSGTTLENQYQHHTQSISISNFLSIAALRWPFWILRDRVMITSIGFALY